MNLHRATLARRVQSSSASVAAPALAKDASGWYLLFLQIADVLATVGALRLAEELRRWLPLGPALGAEGWPGAHIYLLAAVMGVAVYVATGVYRADRLHSIGDEIGTVVKASLIGITLLAGLLYFTDRTVSRWLFLYYGLIKISLVVAIRIGLRGMLRGFRLALTPPRRALIVGAGPIGQGVARHVRQVNGSRYELVGYADNGSAGVAGPHNLPVLGSLDQVGSIVREMRVDELLIALPLREWHSLAWLMSAIHDLPVQVKVIPDYSDLAYLYARSDDLSGMPIVSLKEPALSPWQRATKRMFDVLGASVLLLVSGPILLIGALAVKLDSLGPIFYRQRRVGEGNRSFLMLKLRTMVDGADEHEDALIEGEGDSMHFKKRLDDPRVTRAGAFLRRWSIDELPQLWNVLKGEMSLVGPRPELPALVERYSAGQRKRFAVPQGMTGWWQVNGRPQSVDHKVDYDLWYVRNYSLWLDVRIVLKTIAAVISGVGAV